MARCKHCGTEIPDELEYCDKCADKLNTAMDSESYLDSLLNAVMTEEPERREIAFQKKEASSPVSVSEKPKKAEPKKEEPVTLTEPEASLGETVLFGDGDALPDLNNYSIFDDTDEIEVDRLLAADLQEAELEETESQAEPFTEKVQEFASEEFVEGSEEADLAELFAGLGEAESEDESLFSFVEAEPEASEEAWDEPDGLSEEVEDETEDETEEIEEVEEPVEFSDFADLFTGGVAMPESLEDAMPELFENDEPEEISGDADVGEVASAETDFMDLFGGAEPVQADAGLDALFSGLDDITGEQPVAEEESEPVGVDASADFMDLFGDDDMDLFEFGAEPEVLEDYSASEPIVGKLAEEPKAEKQASGAAQAGAKDEKKKKEKNKEKKQGGFAALFHKLFDNVKVDPSKIKPEPTQEEIEAKKQAAKEAKEKSKEEKAALLAEKKAQEQQVKAEKRRLVLEAKAEKKARKLEEAKLMLEEIEGTRINRAGASIVFIFFAMIAVVIIVGTSIFSYSLSIRNAEYEFERDEYTLAYNEIFGLDIKGEDIVLYDRIMTVMYVQKQLNSYYNYYEMKDYPRALDSLLKGLQRYEKYIELAVKLEIESDLDSVRVGILDVLSASFSMSEQEAMNIIQADSQLEYSMLVYDAVENFEPKSTPEEE